MTGPPEPSPGPGMPDEMTDCWERYDVLLRRCGELEALTGRLAAACADWGAVEEYRAWKNGRG